MDHFSLLPTIVVPARLASTRFPHKLLADAGGMPLILRTAFRLADQVPEYELFFAVDGSEIATEDEKLDMVDKQGWRSKAKDLWSKFVSSLY